MSLAVQHAQADFFRNTSYQPLMFNGAQYGSVREFGNLAFAVISDAGHFVPNEKPDASLEIFKRAISGTDIATGQKPVRNQTASPLTPDEPIHSAVVGQA